MRHFAVLMLAAAIGLAATTASALPDLVPVGSWVNAYVSTEFISPSSCAVEEECTTAGQRRLLRFTAYTQNIGTTNLVLGNPVGNPAFHYHACHGHYHYPDYLRCRLTDSTGTVVSSVKQSFCLLDSFRHNPSAPSSPLFNCTNQGLQAGWGDVYSSSLDCQYVDITNVPPGNYMLELHVNPQGTLSESNLANNMTTVPVTIEAAEPVPPNDLCSSATEIVIMGVPVSGSTESAGTDGAACSSSSAAFDVWYRYVPQQSGTALISLCNSQYDTVVSVHSSCPGSLANMIACNNDSAGPGCTGSNSSEVQMAVVQGTPYLIRVAGFSGAEGTYQLTLTGPGGTSAVLDWSHYR